MKSAELCAGYGGLALAIEQVFGTESAWFSEFEEAPSRILNHHWPTVPNLGDMTKIDWRTVEPVQVLGAGTPCQDLSTAGRRAGMNEGTRSNLWVQMREAIAVQKPKWVVWENVRGAFSACASSEMGQCPGCVDGRGTHKPFLRALGRVLGDLSDLGYDCQWRGLRAADVGACHPRFRVFVLGSLRDTNGKNVEGQRAGRLGITPMADGSRERRSASLSVTDAAMRGRDESGSSATRQGCESARGCSCDAPIADTKCIHGQAGRSPSEPGRCGGISTSAADATIAWGEYEPAIRRWERTIGRPAPRPTEPTGRNNGQRLSPRFTEWMMGLPDGWVTDPAIGISRNEQLKACGNGVVPQQAVAALSDMLQAFQSQEIAA